MVRIRLKGICKSFGKGDHSFEAVKDVSFDIRSPSFFGILGASGAGKTTLMRIIAGLETPTEGELYYDDNLVAKDDKDMVPVEERNVGMVFQNWALYPHLSNYENIAFPLKVKRWRDEDIRKRVKELAETLGISEVVEKRPGQVSGGQQQRVALARALAKNPSLLLLDEPFSNLDANTKDDARSLVRKIQQEFGVTAIIVSHDPSDIFSLAEEVAVISRGELIQVATPRELYDKPKNLRVAGSLGEINILDGSLVQEGTSTGLQIPGLELLADFYNGEMKLNAEVKVGIRPEDLLLLPLNQTEKPVESTELDQGDEWVKLGTLQVDASNYSQGTFIISMLLGGGNGRINGISRQALLPGEKINLYTKKNKIKMFESSSGDLILGNVEVLN